MSQTKIELEIVTPEKVALKDQVDFIVLPSEKGELGVLPGHTHLLAQLTAGELRITKENEVTYFAVSGGFAEVHPHKVEVFAETAEMATEIDVQRAKLAAERAKLEITRIVDPWEHAKARAALTRALIRLRIAEGYSRSRTKK